MALNAGERLVKASLQRMLQIDYRFQVLMTAVTLAWIAPAATKI